MAEERNAKASLIDAIVGLSVKSPVRALLRPFGAIKALCRFVERPSQQQRSGLDIVTGLKTLYHLIQLRWIAVFGQIATIAVVHSLGIPLPLTQMLVVLAALVLFNILSLLRCRSRRPVSHVELFFALLVDVMTLTAQLYYSGGATNPFVFLYLLQVVLGAVLLPATLTWAMVVLTTLCFIGLTVFAHPLVLPEHRHYGLLSLDMLGLLVCFALNAGLLVIFITRIAATLRQRDARLAAVRQRVAEEEHIVRMGLLASGAAHELGTPLSTLAVILGDWRRLPQIKAEPELAAEVARMEAQVTRCKSIVSGILLSAGEARGESSVATTLCSFLDDAVHDWCARRPDNRLRYDNRIGEDLPIVSDSALKQMIGNVLDNAFEASPQEQYLLAARDGESLMLTVRDRGAGFAPAILGNLGKPYQSTKGRPGAGLGLFLVVNVARTLGGTVQASNLAGGGAELRLTLPLSAVALPDEEADHET